MSTAFGTEMPPYLSLTTSSLGPALANSLDKYLYGVLLCLCIDDIQSIFNNTHSILFLACVFLSSHHTVDKTFNYKQIRFVELLACVLAA